MLKCFSDAIFQMFENENFIWNCVFCNFIACRSEDSVVHIMIRNIDGFYDAGGGPAFADLSELVENYKKNPMVEKAGGNVVHLKAVRPVFHDLTMYVIIYMYIARSHLSFPK